MNTHIRKVQQRGSALIVSLIMLSAVTFLAIVSMEGSSVQLKMIANTQQSERVFQNVLSELEGQYSASKEGGSLEDTLGEATRNSSIDPETGEVSYKAVTASTVTSSGNNLSVQVVASGRRNLNGQLNGSTSAGNFGQIKFEIIANESINDIFTSSQTFGITRNLVPKS